MQMKLEIEIDCFNILFGILGCILEMPIMVKDLSLFHWDQLSENERNINVYDDCL
jgi:hypothetical protein